MRGISLRLLSSNDDDQLTLVAVDKRVLDDDAPAVKRGQLLGLAPYLAQVWSAVFRPRPGAWWRNAEDMTGEEVLGGYDLVDGGAALGLSGREEHIRQGHQKDMVVDGGALGGYRALEESGKEGV